MSIDPMTLLLPVEITGDEWPWPVGPNLIEPGCGTVHIRRPAEPTLSVDVAQCRELAACANESLAAVLFEAAWEAERQEEILGESMSA